METGTSSQVSRSDVLIVGAGLAGTATATVLARRGMSVTLVDPNAEFPPLFRAEKLEPDQWALLRKLGLFDGVEPRTKLIREIIHARAGKVVHRRKIQQYGIAYSDIVNSVRSQLPAQVRFVVGRAESVTPDAKAPRLRLSDGAEHEARLLLISGGMAGTLPEALGMRKNIVKAELTMVYGFMLEREDGQPFGFDAITYRPRSVADKLGYITLFRMGNCMRGNMFAYWPARDELHRQMLREPRAALQRVVPGMEDVIGHYQVKGKVEPFRIDLYRMADCARPGVVLLGDSYQSPCPSTGMGLSKVLTDVDVLCNECIPQWWPQQELDRAQIAQFYASANKQAVDDRALRLALAGRDGVMENSLHWRIRRQIRTLRFATGW
jgi:2-polyprenyl-6-methoxyphenol hydroxylase-like FAD-dependent oxidoreductase